MEPITKYVLKGICSTVISAIFTVFGLTVASTHNIVAGTLITVASIVFWGYACLLSLIAELRLKRES